MASCPATRRPGTMPGINGGAPWSREVVVQMPEARFPVEMAGGVPVVTAPVEIDVTSADGLRAALAAAAARGHGTFVVDMSLTRFCDSSGLHTLVAAHRRAHAEGGEVLLVVPDTAVLRSEERRVGKECRSRRSPAQQKKK